jgi:hypothetical protein
MSAVSSALPYAVAIVVSTAPILALVLVMVTTRPPRIATMFLLGWALGILAVAGILVGLVDLSVRPRLPDTAAAIVKALLGAVLAVMAIRAWRRRGAPGADAPAWLSGIARWSTSRAFSVGFGLGSVNPKNLALVASGATAILAAATSSREHVVAVLVFALVASTGIAAPILLRELGGPAMNRGLERASRWMTAHGKTISMAVIAIIAVVLLVAGLRDLFAQPSGL